MSCTMVVHIISDEQLPIAEKYAQVISWGYCKGEWWGQCLRVIEKATGKEIYIGDADMDKLNLYEWNHVLLLTDEQAVELLSGPQIEMADDYDCQPDRIEKLRELVGKRLPVIDEPMARELHKLFGSEWHDVYGFMTRHIGKRALLVFH